MLVFSWDVPALEDPDADLGDAIGVEGSWDLVSLEPVGTEEVVPEDVTITLTLGPDGKAHGTSGCNRYSTGYELDGEGISFGLVAATQMMCPEGRMAWETKFLAAIGGVSTYERDDAQLRLYYDEDQSVLVLKPQASDAEEPEAKTPEEAPDGNAYIVQPGDWLIKIAQRQYGDPEVYVEIVEATNAKAATDKSLKVIANPNLVEVGQKLWLPAKLGRPVPAVGNPLLPLLRGATYRSDFARAGSLQLSDGEFREPIVPGSATELVVTLGEVAIGDLNGDGVDDAVVILYSSPGGSGTFRDLVAVVMHEGTAVPVIGASLGDRVKIETLAIEDSEISVGMVKHASGDPMCCPTQRVTQRYALQLAMLEGS